MQFGSEVSTTARVAGGSQQPEGLSDSSRWSERSVDHRTTIENKSTPGTGVRKKRWHPSGVRTTRALPSGGLRCAPTTGYCLTALQAEIRSLRFHTVSVAGGFLHCQSTLS